MTMEANEAQQLLDWVHTNVHTKVTTDELKDMANDSNLPIDAKKAVVDLPDREWSKEELTEEIDRIASGDATPTGGFFPTSGSPV